MKFEKNKVITLIIIFIILIMYNVIVFVVPFSRGGGFWSGYVFSIIAILLTAAVSIYSFERKGIKSKFYGLPLAHISWCYLIIQIIIGLLEINLQFIPYYYGIAVNIFLLGVCLIGLIGTNTAKEEIERIDENIREKVFFIKSLQADAESFSEKITNDSAKKALKNLAETIRYSDPMSNPQLNYFEKIIELKFTFLSETVKKNDADTVIAVCSELQQVIAERNRKCKILK